MELMILAVIALGILPWVLVFLVFWQRTQLRDLKNRVDRLERERVPRSRDETPVPAAAGQPASEAAPPPVPTHAVAPASAGALPIAAAPREPRSRLDPARLEQQVGGIWLQNVGSVLLLLGAFFLIVWGYATGRIGPEILVLAGVLLGVVVAWRGTVIARTLLALGNALIGVGLGTVYITLYVGHFRMDVLPASAAFSFLAVVALATVAIGLRRRAPTIATMGVIGAFLPQLVAVWIPLQGFRLPLPTLLAYFAVVNGVVFVLAATVGWSGLVIFSMLLTSWTWAANATAGWSFGTQLGLTALFAGLGLAPVVRLVRVPAAVRSIDLLVVALAPILLLLCSVPHLLQAGRTQSAWLLGALGILYIGGAIWVESRRERRDLWKPLTGAATVFLTAALERGIDPEHLAMAWSAEGVVLVALGLGPRRDVWLRGLGYGVSALSACWLAGILVRHSVGMDPGFLHVTTLRDLFCVAALLTVAHMIGRSREHLTDGERGWAPGFSSVAGNLLLMAWIARESGRLRHAVPALAGPDAGSAVFALTGVAWLIHATVLFVLGRRHGAAVLRHTGYVVGTAGALSLLGAYGTGYFWRPSATPFVSPTALLGALGVLVTMAASEILWRGRERLGPSERRMPEVAAGAANAILLLWWAREAVHLAAVLNPGGAGARTLAAIFTSAAWTAQAIGLFGIGWIRNSAFLRWSGLVLFGLTVVKFLAVDLDRVDAFWRFAGAVGIGMALLVVSFLYQRRGRRISAAARPPAEIPGAEAP